MQFGALAAAAAILSALAAGPALAAEAARPACAAMDAALPPAYSAWSTKADLPSAAAAADLSKASLGVGRAVNGVLHRTRQVAYAAQPEKPGGSVAHGGMFALTIAEPGTYRIGISSGAWLDVLQDGKAVVSMAHGPGPACSTLRKMVDFPLQPGRYVVQISANADEKIGILVMRAPAGG